MRLSSTIERSQSPALRAGSVRVSRQVETTPERVFDAWLHAEAARTFLFAGGTSNAISSQMDTRVGGRFRIVRRRDDGEVEYSGEYLEIDRPHRLVFSLFVERYAQRDDRIVVEIAPVEGASLLVLTHEHSLPSPAERARIEGGWATALDELAALCSESTSRTPLHWLRAPALVTWDPDFV